MTPIQRKAKLRFTECISERVRSNDGNIHKIHWESIVSVWEHKLWNDASWCRIKTSALGQKGKRKISQNQTETNVLIGWLGNSPRDSRVIGRYQWTEIWAIGDLMPIKFCELRTSLLPIPADCQAPPSIISSVSQKVYSTVRCMSGSSLRKRLRSSEPPLKFIQDISRIFDRWQRQWNFHAHIVLSLQDNEPWWTRCAGILQPDSQHRTDQQRPRTLSLFQRVR
jgi:hypothetical protein